MIRDAALWRAVTQQLSADQDVFLALVVDHTRHSPGTRGAALAIGPEGPLAGTIGGGVMELRLIERAQRALSALDQAEAPAQLVTLHHKREAPGERSGMICAGRQTNLYVRLSRARHLEAAAQALAMIEADEAAALLITAQGQLQVTRCEPDPTRAPVQIIDQAPDGAWSVWAQLLRQDRAVIFGAGHCGLALSRQLHWLGFHVSVADVREQLVTLRQNVYAHEIITGPDYAQLASRVRHRALTWAVVMTADFPSDVRALLGALREPFVFVGVMGAPAKLKAIRQALRDQGVSEEALDRIVAPVGLPIHSARPEEIAVSVAGQLLQLRPTRFAGLAPSPMSDLG